uniref:Uncharacterized protein n=1 Tax=Lotharella oceanica TaxID=641309 RepID=A0A7S2X5S1_9EUKA|mmetsp:Transcript_11932/g.22979  ORF Transcript_11932/g.22979 Transcript_11932/m.22979 type:complete len:568 (+) Transcript_11932:63-1766(+)
MSFFCGCLRASLYLAGSLGLLAALGASVINSMWMNHSFDSMLSRAQGVEAYNSNNHFLLRNFAPVGDEVRAMALPIVKGKIPDGMDGLFIRNGPNPIPEHGHKKRYHWFDGHGYLHVLKLDSQSQTATYNSGWLQTPRYNYERALGHQFFLGVGEYIGWAGLLKVLFIGPKKIEFAGLTKLTIGQANTALLHHAKRIFAVHEASLPFEIRFSSDGTFHSEGYEDFGTLDMAMSAHPKVDPRTDELLFHGYGTPPNPNLKWGAIRADGSTVNYCGVTTNDSRTPLAHDFAMTSTHVILLDNSVKFEGKKVVEGQVFYFDDQYNMRIGLAPRAVAGADPHAVEWYALDRPLIIMHVMNAWTTDDGRHVMLWACGSTAFDLNSITAKNNTLFSLYEFQFDLEAKHVFQRRVPAPFNGLLQAEFPTIHPKYQGRHSSYGFVGISPVADGRFTGIAKFHLHSTGGGEHVSSINFPEGTFCGEPLFVPDANRDGADEGWMVTVQHSETSGESAVVVYGAETMSEEPVFVIQAPRIPYGFHGAWLSEEDLREHIESWRIRDTNTLKAREACLAT